MKIDVYWCAVHNEYTKLMKNSLLSIILYSCIVGQIFFQHAHYKLTERLSNRTQLGD